LSVVICVAPLLGSPSWRQSISCLWWTLGCGCPVLCVLARVLGWSLLAALFFASASPAPTGQDRIDAQGSSLMFCCLRGASWCLQWVFAQLQWGRRAAGSAFLPLHFPFSCSALPPSSIRLCPDATRTSHGSHARDARSQTDHWVGLAAWVGCGRYRSRSTSEARTGCGTHRSWSWLAQLVAALALTASPPARKARAFLSRAFLAHGSPSSLPRSREIQTKNYHRLLM